MIEMGRRSLSIDATSFHQRHPDGAKPPILHIVDVEQRDVELDAESNGNVLMTRALSIDRNEDGVSLGRRKSSPLSLSQTAQITESVVIITPKAQLALPPSIEKQELTLNVIAVSRQNTIDIITENLAVGGVNDSRSERCDDEIEIDPHPLGDHDGDRNEAHCDSEKSRSESAHSSCSIIDILNESI